MSKDFTYVGGLLDLVGVSDFQNFCSFASSALTEMSDLLFLTTTRKLATISVWQKQNNDQHLAHTLFSNLLQISDNLLGHCCCRNCVEKERVCLCICSRNLPPLRRRWANTMRPGWFSNISMTPTCVHEASLRGSSL